MKNQSLFINFFEHHCLVGSEIIEQIDQDVKRTHPDMHFFSGDSSFAKSNQVSFKLVWDNVLFQIVPS